MTLVELDRALRQLRLSGLADVLETRLRHAQAERLAPLDLMATLVSDELRRREDRLPARRHKLASFRDPDRSLENLDRLQQEDEPRAHLRSRDCTLRPATRGRPVSRPTLHGQEPSRPGDRPRRDPP